MVSSLSKFKNIFGEQDKTGSFDSLTPRNNQATDGSLIDCSPDFLAVNWSTTGGGSIGIFKTKEFLRIKSNFPLIRGHTSPVTDLKFSPFNTGLLASSSEDGTVKLWNIPEEGLKSDLSEELQRFGEHSKKVALLQFNPICKEVIASLGSDADLFVWDITNSGVLHKAKLEDQSYSLEWNSNGSLLGCMLKNKKIAIYDIRSSNPALTTEGHDTGKVQKMGFADGDYIFSTGFNGKGYREIKLYDCRNIEKPVQAQKLDNLSGMMSHYYDEDLGLLYIYGKGEATITYMEVKDGSIKTGSSYSSSDQAIGISFFPKRTMDYNSCELARCAKLTKDSCHYVSFKYPRRNKGFEEEFYPECVLGEPSLSLDQWKQGESKGPIRKKITEIENKFKTEVINFEKKAPEQKKTLVLEEVLSENEKLKCQVNELTNKIADLQEEIEKLRSQQQN